MNQWKIFVRVDSFFFALNLDLLVLINIQPHLGLAQSQSISLQLDSISRAMGGAFVETKPTLTGFHNCKISTLIISSRASTEAFPPKTKRFVIRRKCYHGRIDVKPHAFSQKSILISAYNQQLVVKFLPERLLVFTPKTLCRMFFK